MFFFLNILGPLGLFILLIINVLVHGHKCFYKFKLIHMNSGSQSAKLGLTSFYGTLELYKLHMLVYAKCFEYIKYAQVRGHNSLIKSS